jgi:F-type H+-transporting ATPase subunit delta
MKRSARSLQHELAMAAWKRAGEDGSETATGRALGAVAATLRASGHLRQLLLHPRVDARSKMKLLGTIVKLSGASGPLLEAVVNRRALGLVGGISREYDSLMAARAREATVRIWSADGLSKAELDSLRRVLARAVGKPVKLVLERRKDLIGGLLVQVGERIVDGTVKGAFARLEKKLVEKSSGKER